ncbi:lipopolysaccharide heptosyltransferase II [Luteolibacter yonseiensis]|nr:glycosyltransferase family 9 protein [Luteolibacter yonseiensis]
MAAPERWDEACFSVPALRAMMASGLKTAVLCPENQADFWATLPDLTVIPIHAKAKSRLLAKEIAGNWQASLAWETGLAADVFQNASIPRRLGVDERKLKKQLTHPLAISATPLEHRVRHYLSAVETLGIPTGQPEYFAPADLGVDPVDGTVLLCPGSDFGPSHEWPIERWVELAKKLITSGLRVTVASIGTGRGLGKILSDNLGKSAESFHAEPLDQALPVLAGQSLVISADGSLPHLASHAGATCVVLFGPNDPAWKRPLGKRHASVRRHVECSPCLLPKCPLDLRCQKELDTGRVWQAVLEKLR